MRRIISLLLVSFLSLCPLGVIELHAQAVQVVASCGTLPSTPSVGSANGPITIDQTGKLCVNAVVNANTVIATPLAVVVVATPLSVTVTPSIVVNVATPLSINVPQVAAIVSGAYADGAQTTIGDKGDGLYSGSGSSTLMSIMKGIYAAIVSNASIIVANTLTAGQQTMANSNPVALASNQSVGDPCTFQAKTMTTVSVNTATALIVPGVSGKLIYVCYDKVLDGAAEEVSLVEGTATGGSLKAVDGSTTVAQGNPLAANGGWSSGAGIGTVAQTASPSSNLLVLKSGTATAVIRTTYVQQ